MWMMTPNGFVSIVAKGGEGALMVRARDRESLENFIDCVSGDRERIVEGGGTDYPFRVTSWPAEVGVFLAVALNDVTYQNFKNEAKLRRGNVFADFLSRVWSAGWSLTPEDVQQRERAAAGRWSYNPRYFEADLLPTTSTNSCERCFKKIRKCKCTDEELDRFYADEEPLMHLPVHKLGSMTDEEFRLFEEQA